MKEVGVNLQSKPQKPKAILGKISLWLFPVAPAMVVLSMMWGAFEDLHGEEAWGPLLRGLLVGSSLCIFNVLFASVSIMMGERPRWPALTGLALNFLPALLGVRFWYAILSGQVGTNFLHN
jgi:hypothetical protein